MKLSVAIVIFLLKAGIKQLDDDYNIQSFIGDILEAFGEKTGEKVTSLISASQDDINHVLRDSTLIDIGIEKNRTAQARENIKAILRYTKITNAMISDNNCDAEIIAKTIINKYAKEIGIADDDKAISDVRKVLLKIVGNSIELAQKDDSFINGIIFDIRKTVMDNSAMLRDIQHTTNISRRENMDNSITVQEQLKENTKLLIAQNKMLKQFFAMKSSQMDEEIDWSPSLDEESPDTDPDTVETLIERISGGIK